MKVSSNSTLGIIFFLIFSCSLLAAFADENKKFLECLAKDPSISNDIYTPRNSSYTSILLFSLRNLRFTTKSTPKPLFIVTPERESQIPPVIHCAQVSKLQIRSRSGGHDYEAVSSVAQVPYVILDLINLDEVTVNVKEKTAWVQVGSNIGKLYYMIAEKSPTLGFPAGVCPTVGIGGHISGGGYGVLLRKYGLAADHVIDARIIDVNGRILDRKSMGEDLFWAIRGGGGASFGVIVAWKVELVNVPETVTVFTIQRTMEQNATELINRWQHVAPTIDRDLFISLNVRRANSTQGGRNISVGATFVSVFQGGSDRLLRLMQEKFPELGLVREDCIEMSWIQSVLYYYNFPINSLEILLNKTQNNIYFKAKIDYVQKPIPIEGLEGMLRKFLEPEAKDSQLIIIPYGGRMAEVSESAIPFPHRAGNLYKIQQDAIWSAEENINPTKYIAWVRRLYNYLTPYVSKSPRVGYINYRDLDLGVNNERGPISYQRARTWGLKYFKNNFDRLIHVKTTVDPNNFFRNEQSIPVIHGRWVDQEE